MNNTQPARPWHEDDSTEPVPGTDLLSTVIASVPGIAEQSLRATLEALPSVQVVGTATGCLSALQMVRDRQADLVVVDSNLPLEDVRVFLRQLKQEGLPTRSLVLSATSDHVRRALAAGADAAIRRDVPIRHLGVVLAGFHRANPVETQVCNDEIPWSGDRKEQLLEKAGGEKPKVYLRRPGVLHDTLLGRVEEDGRVWRTHLGPDDEIGHVNLESGKVYAKRLGNDEYVGRVDLHDGKVWRHVAAGEDEYLGRAHENGRMDYHVAGHADESIGRVANHASLAHAGAALLLLVWPAFVEHP